MPENTTKITPPRVPLVDARTGLVTREWYRFFMNLYYLTGDGQSSVTIPELQLIRNDIVQVQVNVSDLEQQIGTLSDPNLSPKVNELSDIYAPVLSNNVVLAYDLNNAHWRITPANTVGSPIDTKTSSYPVTASDYTILCDATSGTLTITLPLATDVEGQIYNVKKVDSSVNDVTLAASGGDLIDGSSSVSTNIQWTTISVQSDGTNWYVL